MYFITFILLTCGQTSAPQIDLAVEIDQEVIIPRGFLEFDLHFVNREEHAVDVGMSIRSRVYWRRDVESLSEARMLPRIEGLMHPFYLGTFELSYRAELEPLETQVIPVLANLWTLLPPEPGRYTLVVEAELVSPTFRAVGDPEPIKWHYPSILTQVEIQEPTEEQAHAQYADLWEEIEGFLNLGSFDENVRDTPLYCDFVRAAWRIIYSTDAHSLAYKRRLLESGTLDTQIVFHLFYIVGAEATKEAALFVRHILLGNIKAGDEYIARTAASCALQLIKIGAEEIGEILAPYVPDINAPKLDRDMLFSVGWSRGMRVRQFHCPIPETRPD